jgi:uncharacterized protein (TIGR02246 family)
MSLRTITAPPVLALGLLLSACGSPPADLVPTFRAQFDRAAADWNGGDLDGFMADYARDSLTGFVSAGRVERGYDWIRAHYAPRFAKGARRDSLWFENLQVRPLGQDFALVTARYVLATDGATVSSGPFTLVMQRQTDGWKIVHDHTSSDPR